MAGWHSRSKENRPIIRLMCKQTLLRKAFFVGIVELMDAGIVIRDAVENDLDQLQTLREKRIVHVDRIRDADGHTLRYLVAERAGELVGFVLLLYAQPPSWQPQTAGFPLLVDLYVHPAHRSRGIGATIIHYLESAARARGFRQLFLCVDIDNPRARQLYERLGYHAIQCEPYVSHWRVIDSEGTVQEGDESLIDMCKLLGGE